MAPRSEGKSGNSSEAYYRGASDAACAGALSCQGFVTRNELTEASRGMVIVLVGLPGRGKSFISRKLDGFLRWQCKRTETFNAGKYRREANSADQSGRADFFDNTNPEALAIRRQAAMDCLRDLLDFLDNGGDVGIFDATNSTAERRQAIVEEARRRQHKYHVIFVEIICDDPEVLMTNFKNKVRYSPDFKGLTMDEALRDLQARVKQYEDRYETVDDDTQSYIKLYNMSSKVMVNRIYGSVAKSLMPYLMGVHIGTRPIWLVRTAQVQANASADAGLTDEGLLFAERLSAFVTRRMHEFHGATMPDKPVKVLSSTVTSCKQTVEAFFQSSDELTTQSFKQTSALGPLDRGRLSGAWWVDQCTDKPAFDSLRKRDPKWLEQWKANKLTCRFPGGESYKDVMARVEPVLLEMEMTTRPVLCVSHITVIQVLLCYFLGCPLGDAWDISVPEHHLFEITPTLGGSYRVETINIDDEPLGPNQLLRRRSRRLS